MGCTAGMIIIAFPLEEWSELFTKEVFDLPFYMLPFGISITVGLLAGLIVGIQETQKLKRVEEWLTALVSEQPSIETNEIPADLEEVFAKITDIQNQLKEKTWISQKLVNEKVKIEEKHIQKVISEERNRLARELHDSVSQQLFAASMLMSAVIESRVGKSGAESKQLELVEGMIQQSQLEMRALLLHLRPIALKGKSLKKELKNFLRN